MKKKLLTTSIIVFALIAGFVAYRFYRERNSNTDIYYDKNGCAHSRSGGVHPDLCINQ
ncbi:MAG TPA: hypothetical protein VLF41_01060 [Candidatus Nanoarchaeia archaeon]|nr:hypothetical protein [Candidatus Nanoarchaeia archaeon]